MKLTQGKLLVLVLISYGLVAVETAGSDYEKTWSYKTDSKLGPKDWSKKNNICGKDSQSPINILTRDVKYHDSLGKLKLNNYGHVSENMYFDLQNRNTDIAFKAKTKKGEVPQEVVFQDTTYRFYQFHFHWGSTNYKGSEHVVDFQRFAGEMHIIHYNTKYANISEAVDKSDGLLVWGHFLKIDSTDKAENSAFKKVLDNFSKAKYCCNVTKIPSFSLFELLPEQHEDFYHYKGSLTTPPCYESVMWIVDRNPISISEEQIAKFRELKNNAANQISNIGDNDRPAQPLNGREVKRNFNAGVDDAGSDVAKDSSSVLIQPLNAVIACLSFLIVFLTY